MMKNTKGFTLVELLAAIIILGIISVFAIPQIVGLLTSSRNKIYVSDAKRLIAQVEYKIQSAHSKIEKPDPNDCIVISLLYLDTSDFDVAPNGGIYQKENSFVVVKNNNGKLEYAVTLVEKTKKNYYRGIDLVSQSSLSTGAFSNSIKDFSREELIDVETGVTKEYINGKISNFLSGDVVSVYNHLDVADDLYFDDN